MRRVFMSASLVLLLTACGGASDPLEENGAVSNTQHTENRNGLYARNLADGDPSSINQNPAFRDLVENRPDLGDDQRAIKRTVNETEGVRSTMVAIDGNRVTIQARFQKRFTPAEKERLTDLLFDQLRAQMPRYDIHLTIR
ncbi:hypothetical protein [Aureibacillus halotolerans]|uniref:Sporulation lipoprotein YhcN/YlaJ n=1 Tax=Aureibacillus halotolerans TaxID=1508390 RepID=A0A4R6U0L1_9BACI|nr:hypothetical protein [Aureibacillus halotolerans]TDQ38752.1 hypothetical protein EV213_109121 [Aureibacillus halotolerans]